VRLNDILAEICGISDHIVSIINSMRREIKTYFLQGGQVCTIDKGVSRDEAARHRYRGRNVRPAEGQLMQKFDLPRRLAAEVLGTALLVATVVGSGIMAESLTKDVALALLGNTLPTGAILVVLITILGPISGAHFNPAVTLIFALKRDLIPRDAMLYMTVQIAGGIVGTVMAHAMFALPLLDVSMKARTGGAQWLAEGVAAFGLVATILAGLRFERPSVPWLVGLYITAAYWFTSSTSFANPAVAVARSMTNTFSGIRPADLPGFIVAELCGAVAALMLMGWLLRAGGKAAPMSKEAQL
jgi:glycerol uptake facilitator-like aquaporin